MQLFRSSNFYFLLLILSIVACEGSIGGGTGTGKQQTTGTQGNGGDILVGVMLTDIPNNTIHIKEGVLEKDIPFVVKTNSSISWKASLYEKGKARPIEEISGNSKTLIKGTKKKQYEGKSKFLKKHITAPGSYSIKVVAKEGSKTFEKSVSFEVKERDIDSGSNSGKGENDENKDEDPIDNPLSEDNQSFDPNESSIDGDGLGSEPGGPEPEPEPGGPEPEPEPGGPEPEPEPGGPEPEPEPGGPEPEPNPGPTNPTPVPVKPKPKRPTGGRGGYTENDVKEVLKFLKEDFKEVFNQSNTIVTEAKNTTKKRLVTEEEIKKLKEGLKKLKNTKTHKGRDFQVFVRGGKTKLAKEIYQLNRAIEKDIVWLERRLGIQNLSTATDPEKAVNDLFRGYSKDKGVRYRSPGTGAYAKAKRNRFQELANLSKGDESVKEGMDVLAKTLDPKELAKELNESDGNGNGSSLHYAVNVGDLETVKKYVGWGAKIDNATSTNNKKDTPVHVAIRLDNAGKKDRFKIFKFFLEKSPTLDFSNNLGETPLWLSCVSTKKHRYLELMLQNPTKCDVNKTGPNGRTYLLAAVMTNNKKAIKTLAKHPEFKIINRADGTPLLSKYKGIPPVLPKTIKGDSVLGLTPLLDAVWRGDLWLAKTIVAAYKRIGIGIDKVIYQEGNVQKTFVGEKQRLLDIINSPRYLPSVQAKMRGVITRAPK